MPKGRTSVNNNDDYIVISVESKKGGVGKTTAALNIAKLLIDKGYAVLFLDVDITGTNVADALESPFWKEITNPIQEEDGNGETKKSNLLEWFDRKFMSGLDCPIISNNDELKQINIIGSQIYNDEKSGDKKDALICSPSLLFDELHSFWFIEFLKQICSQFSKITNKKSAFVIDNSPGFVGIAPAVHQWLTDLGPERGKFLTVSSLDKQDMVSCCHGVNEIHQIFKDKHESAQIFQKAIENKDISFEGKDKTFFIRLVEEYGKDWHSKESKSSAFKNSEKIKTSELEYYFNSGELGSPSRYQNWIINRVPRGVVEGSLNYNASEVFNQISFELSELPRYILDVQHDASVAISRGQMVQDDEYIAWQFLQNMISPSQLYRKRRSHVDKMLDSFFKKFKNRVRSKKSDVWLSSENGMQTHAYFENLRNIKDMQQYVESMFERLNQLGFSYLTRLVRPEWHPMYPFRILRDLFSDLMQESDYFEFDFVPFDYETGPVNEEAIDNMQELRHNIMKYTAWHKTIEMSKWQMQLTSSFTTVVSFLFSSPLWHKEYIHKMTRYFGVLLSIQMRHLEQKRKKSNMNKGFSVIEFLVSEEYSKEDFYGEESVLNSSSFGHDIENFNRFYKSLCYAQSRLIDLQRDTEFLLEVLKAVIMTSKDEIVLLPYIRPLLEDVIEKKRCSHENGRKRYAKGFAEANYMVEFQKVLSGVISKWGIV